MAEEKDPELSLVMSSDDQEDGTQGASAMMSIFASYYGIEDNSFEEKSPAELIDSARFNADAYVRVCHTAECLIKSDTAVLGRYRRNVASTLSNPMKFLRITGNACVNARGKTRCERYKHDSRNQSKLSYSAFTRQYVFFGRTHPGTSFQ